MSEEERLQQVRDLLFDYVRSPSLRHIRDPHAVSRLALEILRRLDRRNAIWQKWDAHREQLLQAALPCWIPIEDLHAFLNAMPGPALTRTDVEQRLAALEGEEHFSYPKEALLPGCRALYAEEKAQGTELPAIVGLLRRHVEREEERIRRENEAHFRERRAEERQAREQRLLSGADCGWTQLAGGPHWFCRKNGRTYRISPTADRMWALVRVSAVDVAEKGGRIGIYRGRGDASKALATIAYQPEPRW